MYVCLYTFIVIIAEVDVLKIKILLPIKQTIIIIIIKMSSEYHFHRTILCLSRHSYSLGAIVALASCLQRVGIEPLKHKQCIL